MACIMGKMPLPWKSDMANLTPELKQLEEVDYTSGVHKLVLLSSLVVCFIIAFLANFPVEERIEEFLKSQLATIPGCRPSFGHLKFELLLPKVVISDVEVPGQCLGGETPLKMRHLTINFKGPSLSPFGPAFSVMTDLQGQPMTIDYVAGLGSHMVHLDETLTLARLSGALPNLPKMDGHLNLSARVTFAKGALEDLRLMAESQDFTVRAQTMGDFKIPQLNLKSFLLKMSSESPHRLMVEQFILGAPSATNDSPIRASFKGPIEIDPSNFSSSKLNLKGEAALSPTFLEAFPILNLMLPQFTQKDGFYQIGLYGTVGNPRPSPP